MSSSQRSSFTDTVVHQASEAFKLYWMPMIEVYRTARRQSALPFLVFVSGLTLGFYSVDRIQNLQSTIVDLWPVITASCALIGMAAGISLVHTNKVNRAIRFLTESFENTADQAAYLAMNIETEVDSDISNHLETCSVYITLTQMRLQYAITRDVIDDLSNVRGMFDIDLTSASVIREMQRAVDLLHSEIAEETLLSEHRKEAAKALRSSQDHALNASTQLRDYWSLQPNWLKKSKIWATTGW